MVKELLKQYNDSITIEKLAKKSRIPLDRLEFMVDHSEEMSLLEAAKLGVGFKKCGIYADEHMLLGEERHEKLFNEWFMRNIRHKDTAEDLEYLEMQKTILTGIDITWRRVNKGLSRKQLAELTGVDVRSIEKYEVGEKQIEVAAAKTVYALAKGLDCRMEDILRKEKL